MRNHSSKSARSFTSGAKVDPETRDETPDETLRPLSRKERRLVRYRPGMLRDQHRQPGHIQARWNGMTALHRASVRVIGRADDDGQADAAGGAA